MFQQENTNEVYVVMKSTGQYEDKYDRPVAVFDTEKKANDYIEKLESADKEIEELAITDKFDNYNNEVQSDYSNMIEEYKCDLILKTFPRLAEYNYDNWYDYESHLTEEEREQFYNIEDDEESSLAEWMRDVKKYPEDVINATITYNYQLQYDETYAYYHFYKVPFNI